MSVRTCFGQRYHSSFYSTSSKCTSVTDFSCGFASALGRNFSPKPKVRQLGVLRLLVYCPEKKQTLGAWMIRWFRVELILNFKLTWQCQYGDDDVQCCIEYFILHVINYENEYFINATKVCVTWEAFCYYQKKKWEQYMVPHQKTDLKNFLMSCVWLTKCYNKFTFVVN